ncbi:MAG: ATP-binding cassette domain-containing protein, partial [Myxococcota bacterium]
MSFCRHLGVTVSDVVKNHAHVQVPLLDVRDLCVTHRRFRAAPPPFMEQRELPQVARMLWHAIAPAAEQRIFAVTDVQLQVARGASLGILGETGAGKSSLARALSGAIVPDEGVVLVDGIDVHRSRGDARRRLRTLLQLI